MTKPESPIYVCRVQTPDGFEDYVTLVSPESSLQHGLAPEAIVGVLSRPLNPGEQITPQVFARNRMFVEFLHEVIARHVPSEPSCRTEARRLGSGWLYIIDQRTATPAGDVPPEDIVGSFEVKDGDIVPSSYRSNPKHVILSANGFFQLSQFLHSCLLKELSARQATS